MHYFVYLSSDCSSPFEPRSSDRKNSCSYNIFVSEPVSTSLVHKSLDKCIRVHVCFSPLLVFFYYSCCSIDTINTMTFIFLLTRDTLEFFPPTVSVFYVVWIEIIRIQRLLNKSKKYFHFSFILTSERLSVEFSEKQSRRLDYHCVTFITFVLGDVDDDNVLSRAGATIRVLLRLTRESYENTYVSTRRTRWRAIKYLITHVPV